MDELYGLYREYLKRKEKNIFFRWWNGMWPQCTGTYTLSLDAITLPFHLDYGPSKCVCRLTKHTRHMLSTIPWQMLWFIIQLGIINLGLIVMSHYLDENQDSCREVWMADVDGSAFMLRRNCHKLLRIINCATDDSVSHQHGAVYCLGFHFQVYSFV